MPLTRLPGMISLGGGLPNGSMFPIKGMSFEVASAGSNAPPTTLTLTKEEVNEALQYSATPGLDKLIAQLMAMQRIEHQPAAKNWSLAVLAGSQDGLVKAFEMLVSPESSIIVEKYTYSGTLAFLHPYGCKLLVVDIDEHGIVPESLEHVLQNSRPPHKPRVLYTIPTGQNPTGSTLTLERRHKIYELACKHDLIIIEDDPYFFLYYGHEAAPANAKDYKRPHLQSFFSMDTEGRVLRFDSLSKALSSGLRLGFVTGPTPLVNRLNLHTQATNLHPSGVSQVIATKLLDHWGVDGWAEHVRNVCYFYLQRRDKFSGYVKKHLGDLAHFHPPAAGMFAWLRLNGVVDSQQLIQQKAIEAKVIMLPGQACSADRSSNNYVRAAFSVASDQDMDTAMSRLGLLLGADQR